MPKKQCSLETKGHAKRWSIPVLASESDLADWQADGVDIELVVNTVPWSVSGIARVWCWLQDLFYWRLFKR